MNRLTWQTKASVSVGHYEFPCAEGLMDYPNNQAGIRRDSKTKLMVKSFFWPLFSLREDLLINGFIQRTVGEWIRKLVNQNIVFLEVGCGNMSLRKYLPPTVCYNAFDLSLSEFHLRRVLKMGGNSNIALATATDIPLKSDSVNLIASTEVFEHIPEIDKAMAEILRVAMRGAKLVCSISNNLCYKYQQKGPHPDHVNSWSYEEFIRFMDSHGFKLLKGLKKGYWIPLPAWLTKASYQLPLAPRDEFYCTNFFYKFEVEK